MNTKVRVSLILWLFLLNVACSFRQDPSIRYEAEAGTILEMTVKNDSSASGGQYLSMEKSSSVKWEALTEHAGYYQVIISYRTIGGDKMQVLMKNGSDIPVGFDMAADWNQFSQPFYLDSGINELGIKEGWGNMDIDWISLEEASIQPDIAPKRNTYYLQYPRNLVFKIDNYRQEIREILLNDQPLTYSVKPYPYQESAVWLEVPASELKNNPEGTYDLLVKLKNFELKSELTFMSEPQATDMVIVAPDVEHGSSLLVRLPSGKNMLIDCGKTWVRDSIIVPMLHRHKVDTIHTFILTHYHGDHDGGDSGKFIMKDFHVEEFIDYNTFPTGYLWEQDGVGFKIVNSYEDGDEENTRSLAIKISYNDFDLMHGGDTYAVNQQKIMERFPEDVPAEVFYANHHFHGSVNAGYIHATNPDLVLLQAQEAIYARPAYMVKYKRESESVLNKNRPYPIETLPALEVGTTVIRINSGDNWWYETYREQDSLIIPYY